MQLKLKRFTTEKGMISKKTVFNVNVIALPSSYEDKLLKQTGFINVSLNNYLHASGDDAVFQMETFGQVSIAHFLQGYTFSFEKYQKVVKIENNIVSAIQQIIRHASIRESFDGAERVVDVTDDAAEVIAED